MSRPRAFRRFIRGRANPEQSHRFTLTARHRSRSEERDDRDQPESPNSRLALVAPEYWITSSPELTKTSATRSQHQTEALDRAQSGKFCANDVIVIQAFCDRGIPANDITPRVNVLTFNAWRALGRTVRKGQHGVRLTTMIPCTKKDAETGEKSASFMRPWQTTVFHITQTRHEDDTDTDTDTTDDSPTSPATMTTPEPATLALIVHDETPEPFIVANAEPLRLTFTAACRVIVKTTPEPLPLPLPLLASVDRPEFGRQYRLF